jgi:membrane protein YqaA with SNARE-associated domain
MDSLIQFLIQWGYLGIFITAFLSGSILPLASEAILVSYVYSGLEAIPCIIVATIGNTLGGITCYYIGYLGKMDWIEKYLRIDHKDLEKAHHFVEGRGAWMAFFAFIPVIGDIILVLLGILRSNTWIVIVAMTIGKFIRYLIVAWGTLLII